MKRVWWKEVVGYQIYPRSFMDSNNDGIGDLNGIVSKLDYLKALGIDVIWICPMYKSPNDDNGYDISDYQDIMDEFGKMEDFDNLLKEIHKRDMKLIIDLVVNHTSDEHPWFIESRSSRDNPKRDWYIWRDGKDGLEPNNWESIFNGSAWEYDSKTDQYFLHLFTKRQPDLNWENEEVRIAIYDMINWWLDKGVDGFRVDAISHLKKEEGLKDMPNPYGKRYVSSFEKHMNVEGIHKLLEDLKTNTFAKYDIMTVGEANGVSAEDAHLWVHEENGKFNMVFQFEHLVLWDEGKERNLNVIDLKKVLSAWQNNLHGVGWNALFIENHDIPRVVSKWGNDKEYWRESATALGLMYFMQEGTPFIYQGQEIGMNNVKFDYIEEYDDVKTINSFNDRVSRGETQEEALENVWRASRDNARTPMQWNNKQYAGFSKVKPWMHMNSNYTYINVEMQQEDENSILNFYKKMINIRKSNLGLVYGKYELILDEHKQIYSYIRKFQDEKYLIITNLSSEEAQYDYPQLKLEWNNLLISNVKVERHDNITRLDLKPYEARMYRIS